MTQALEAESSDSPRLYLRTLKDFRLKTTLSQLRQATHLTAADWRIWAYLEEVAGGDRKPHPFPPIDTVQAECLVSKATFYRTIGKLQDCGFLELVGGAQ